MITFDNLPLAFTLGAWEEMDENVCSLDELFDMYRAEDNKNRLAVDTMQKTLKVAVIFAKAAGTEITYDDLHSELMPGETIALQGAIMAAVNEGLDFENKKNQRRDLVLEELDAAEGKNA